MLSTAVSADAGRPGAGTGPDGSSRQSPGAWKDIGGAMGKKYLEALQEAQEHHLLRGAALLLSGLTFFIQGTPASSVYPPDANT